jgi:EAL domain-containing protein (putative c-di-GMP-specific phosphodiesterase class I)
MLINERQVLGNELRQALLRGELFLQYQPEIELRSGRITGVEALIRWNHPTRGLIVPDVIIPLAEQIGLIPTIGEWVLQEACLQACEWHRQHPEKPYLTVSVNLSVRQFRDINIVERVARALRETRLPPETLRLEITETALIEHMEPAVRMLHRLGTLGVQLALDDFGTGYSSLNYLRQFAVNSLKIDRSFVQDVGSSERTGLIVSSLVSLAHALGMHVTAEGIETASQLARLIEIGCDYGQGFYLCRPLTGDLLSALLAERQT